MSLDEENFNSEISERRPSSNPIITAWQIQSTLNNMEEFIKFIEQFETQRQQLENILPFIQRIKRVQEEKEYFNKQLLDLAKFIYPSDLNQKQETLIKSENKQKSTIQKHFKCLSNFTKEINNSNAQNSKKIVQLKKRIQQSKQKRQQDKIEKKKHLSQQLNQNIKKQINSIEEKISSHNSSQKRTQSHAYEQFIEQYIFQKLRSQKDLKQQNSLDQSQISQSPSLEQSSYQQNRKLTFQIDNDSLKRQLGQKFNELGQIKCKLFSLQDKKRKITVKNIMANKIPTTKQAQYDNSQLTNVNRKFKVIKAQYNKVSQVSQKEERDEKKQNGLFGSFLAIFSNQNVKNEHKDSSKKNNSGKKQEEEKQIAQYRKEMSNSQQKMQLGLQQIDDKQMKLKIAQIHAQILQLREQINIVINQNIFDQVLGSMMRLKSVNEQLQSYIDQLRRVMTIIQKQRKVGQVYLPDLRIFKENQQVKFFLNFIEQRLITRQCLIKNLFKNITYSISVAKKYISRRLAEIQDSLLLFIQSNHTKDKKIKALQTLQSRPQFLFINSGLDSLSSEINQILEMKLIPLQKLLENEPNQWKKLCLNKTQNLFKQNKSSQEKQCEDILSCEIDAVEKIMFSQLGNSDSKSYRLLFDFYFELSKKILDIFY